MDEALPWHDAPWTEVARLVRQLCVLRLEARPSAALELERGELARAISSARESTASSVEAEQRLAGVWQREAARVADAVVLAELLAPRLAGLLPVVAPGEGSRLAPQPKAAPPRPKRGGETIADFIDEMLVQERTGRR